MLRSRLLAHPRFRRLLDRLDAAKPLDVGGAWGPFGSLLLAALSQSTQCPILLLHPSKTARAILRTDLYFFRDPKTEIHQIPRFLSGVEEYDPDSRCAGLRAFTSLESKRPDIHLTPLPALESRYVTPHDWKLRTVQLQTQAPLDPEELVQRCIENTFEPVARIEHPGEISWRGSIVDIFPDSEPHPIRIEFDDETLSSIRRFDLSSQTILSREQRIEILLARSVHPLEESPGVSLQDHLPSNTLVVLWDAAALQEDAGGAEELLPRLASHPCIRFHPSLAFEDPTSIRFDITTLDPLEADLKHFYRDPDPLFQRIDQLLLLFESSSQQKAFKPPPTKTTSCTEHLLTEIGNISAGFHWKDERLAIAHHADCESPLSNPSERSQGHSLNEPIYDLGELLPGDYVIHLRHGVARFLGTEHLEGSSHQAGRECLHLEFARGTQLYVPWTQTDLIQKYIGVRGSQPSLDTVGGKSWKGKQKKVLAALESMAEGMLEVQARRKLEKGIDFGPDDILQSAFEKAFPHTETPDQTVASREVKGDMARSQPMDRLLCGDVGYGKTEIAMRAAFKAIASGYQVAILVPTTVLAHQHEQTFKERFADFPVRIEVLSRMQKPSRRNLILEDTELGAVDCLIGTHRILSQDVQFERLGLVVIDEEQRFGVRAKELIKRWRETVDLLTMTATPIPRTLHMSLLGLRDISTLGTPPRGRKGVRTRVGPAGTNHIAGAIRHELERGGQVYFVHNRIHDIGKTQDFLERLIPEARITYAHGRMSGPQLERIIDAFVRHEIDVLVTTTIIESGVDIPNVNTLIVEDAHRFGLADLHQIRGRVGRGSRQAYAYFLTPYDQRVPESGRKRLRVLEDHQNLGAGLAIALRDLEIRGAGNILGTHQHGHIAAVGYEMYCKLLRKTVSLMTGETLPQQDLPGCHVTLINSSKIPVSYIPSDPLRLSFYRRLAHSRNEEELLTICQVLENDFGPLPPSVMDLMNSTRIRIAATRIGLTLLRELPDRFVLQAPSIEPVRMRLEEQGLAHRLIDFETAHLLIPGSTTPNDLLLTLLGLSLTSGGRYALSSTGSDG